jgi:Plasmid pRiA4b ORF-3-like protein
VTEACRVLDIRLPRARVRSALDVHELMRDWAVAVDAGFTVPADIALADLHAVIARVMGWNGGHLHVFDTGSAEYGTTGYDLGHVDDSRVPLSEVLPVPGTKLRYTYDFGDDWRHDVKLEEFLPEEPGVTYPFCLAGNGACPPDDCGGAWGMPNSRTSWPTLVMDL